MLLGAIYKAIKGTIENVSIGSKLERMEKLAATDPLALVPEGFRPSAEIRLRLAESESMPTADSREAFLNTFERIRKAGLEEMTDRAPTQTVTRDEMIRLVKTLDDYAKASHADIEKVSVAVETVRGTLATEIRKMESDRRLHMRLRIWLVIITVVLVCEGIGLAYVLSNFWSR